MTYKTLKDIWRDDLKQFWLWYGKRWNLAIVLRKNHILFPHYGFNDDVDHFMAYPVREICEPVPPEGLP